MVAVNYFGGFYRLDDPDIDVEDPLRELDDAGDYNPESVLSVLEGYIEGRVLDPDVAIKVIDKSVRLNGMTAEQIKQAKLLVDQGKDVYGRSALRDPKSTEEGRKFIKVLDYLELLIAKDEIGEL